MAIETTFSIKQISVEQALAEAEKKVDRSAQRMDASLDKVGKDSGKNLQDTLGKASKGMDAVGKAGGKVGGVLKNLTGGIAGMMSPIGMVTAGITGIIALVVKWYETAQAKIQALIHSSEYFVQQAKDKTAKLGKEQETDQGYMQRLVQINQYETVDNATKEESIRIINLLTGKYGDLGLSIDKTTGKIIGLTAATQKLQQQQQTQLVMAKISEARAMNEALEAQEREIMPRRPSKEEINRIFGGPKTRAEYLEDIATNLTISQSQGMVVPDRPLKKAREERAQLEWEKYHTGGYVIGIEKENEGLMALEQAIIKVSKMKENATKEAQESLEKESNLLFKMRIAYQKMGVAERMQKLYAADDKEFEKWKKIYGKAYDYYRLLRELVEIERSSRPTSSDPNDAIIKQHSEDAQKLMRTLKQAENERATALTQQAGAEKTYNQAGMSKKDIMRELEQENWDYTDKIHNDEEALKRVQGRLENLIELQKSYDQYKNDKGDIEDKAKNAEFLQVSNKILEVKTEQAQKEAEIAKAQAEQLNLQAKLKQYQEELNKAERERIKEQAKKTLKWLFSGVLGDLKERTNSLISRGGYMKNVNTSINVAQVNRQILNTVITANNYLSSIRAQLQNVGKI